MKKLEMKQMETIEGGADRIDVGCAVAGIGLAVASVFTSGFAFLLGSGMVSGFCGGYAIAGATSGSSTRNRGGGGKW